MEQKEGSDPETTPFSKYAESEGFEPPEPIAVGSDDYKSPALNQTQPRLHKNAPSCKLQDGFSLPILAKKRSIFKCYCLRVQTDPMVVKFAHAVNRRIGINLGK